MKKFLILSLLVIVAATVASAELLTTANPIGQGKWAVLGAYLSDANVGNASAVSRATIGGYAGYGINDKLDVYLQAGSANLSGVAPLTSTMTAIGLNVKYQIAAESASMPVSVALGAGYKTLNITQSALLGGDMSGSQMLVGVGISKMMVPFVPYGGLTYRTTAAGGAQQSTQIDLTVGSAIAWSTQGAVFVEYTLQQMTPAGGGAAYSSGQMAAGVGYAL